MPHQNKIQLLEECKVRTLWDEEAEKWYFSIVNVVGVFTPSSIVNIGITKAYNVSCYITPEKEY